MEQKWPTGQEFGTPASKIFQAIGESMHSGIEPIVMENEYRDLLVDWKSTYRIVILTVQLLTPPLFITEVTNQGVSDQSWTRKFR